ncbi:hypothetical protein ACWDO7_22775 [Streptomyces sp. NPDC003656]
MTNRTHWTVEFGRDITVGSRILARSALVRGRSLYALAARTTGRTISPVAPKAATAEGYPPGGDAPADQTAPGSGPEAGATAKQKASSRARSAQSGLEGWAAAALVAYGGWCFLRHPLAHGWHALAPDLPVLLPGALVQWMCAAWLAAQREKPPLEDQEGGPGEGCPTRDEVLGAEQWFWRLVITRVAAAVKQRRRGVLLVQLLEVPGVPAAWTVTTVREHCERLGIPVRSMRIRGVGKGPTHGVHVDDLTGALGMPLEEALARLPQPPVGAVEEAPIEGPAAPPVGAEQTARQTASEGVEESGPASPSRTTAPTPLAAAAPPTPGRG